MSSRGPPETDAVASLAVLRRRFWRPVWATITNLMKRAFSDEIVLAPKLFLLPSVFVLFLLVDSCVIRRMSVVCLLPEGLSYKHQCDACRTRQRGTLFVSSIFGR